MSTPTAEVMISPELTITAMKKMEQDFSKGFKRVADDAQKEIEKGVAEGIKDGVKKGRFSLRGAMGAAGGAMRGGFDRLGGFKAMGGGIAAIGLAGLLDTIARADQGMQNIDALLGENSAKGQIATAKGAGMSIAEFSQFSETLKKSGGFTEQQDINDIAFDINARVVEAQRDGEGLLSNFTQYTGQERINRVLAGISTQSGDQQIQTLDELGFSGETGSQMLAVIQDASKGGTLTGAETLENLNNMNKSDGERIAAQLVKENELAQVYREKQLAFQLEYKTKMLDKIDGEKITTLFTEREREANQQVKLIEDFNENMKNAAEARAGIDAVMNTLNETTVLLTGAIRDLVNYMDKGTIGEQVQTAITNVTTSGKTPATMSDRNRIHRHN